MLKKTGFICGAFFALSAIIVFLFGKIWPMGLVLTAIFLYVAYSKNCRGCESTWLFLLIAVAFLPLNIALSISFFDLSRLFIAGMIGRLSAAVLMLSALFSLEEIVIGIIGRIIWKNQEGDAKA